MWWAVRQVWPVTLWIPSDPVSLGHTPGSNPPPQRVWSKPPVTTTVPGLGLSWCHPFESSQGHSAEETPARDARCTKATQPGSSEAGITLTSFFGTVCFYLENLPFSLQPRLAKILLLFQKHRLIHIVSQHKLWSQVRLAFKSSVTY